MTTFNIEITKRRLPAMWEAGGGSSNTGDAIIITNNNGGPKKPVYIRQKGSLSNSVHALIIVQVEDYIISTKHHRRDFDTRIYKIKNIDIENKVAEADLLYTFSEGEWDKEPPDYLAAAIDAATKKACDYHCRRPYYILKKEETIK